MEKGPSVTVVKKTTVRRRSSEKKKARKSGKEKVQVHVSKKERIVRPRSSRTRNKKKETKKIQAFSKESGDSEGKTILDRMQMVMAAKESTDTRPCMSRRTEGDEKRGNNEGVSISTSETISLFDKVEGEEESEANSSSSSVSTLDILREIAMDERTDSGRSVPLDDPCVDADPANLGRAGTESKCDIDDVLDTY